MKIYEMEQTRIDKRYEQRFNRSHNCQSKKGRIWVGVFLLVVGGLLLARASGVVFPAWFFTWPMLLIGFGLLSGIRHRFANVGWIIPVLIGTFFLLDDFMPDLRLKPYIWPMAIILVGLVFIFRPQKKRRWPGEPVDEDNEGQTAIQAESQNQPQGVQNDRSEVIDATAILGGIKKNVLSKNFKGGDVTTFMGGAEINLTQADLTGKVTIDCFNMFGGTKLIIPADWDVQSEIVTIFGGLEDKRHPAPVNPNKVLYLDGTCIFGGVEIKSY